jgi:hypothetical protein
MPHSEASNARRRELYAEAKKLGFTARDAGHFYSTKKLEAANAAFSEGEVRRGESQSARLELQRQRMEQRLGRPIDTTRAAERYRPHNSFKFYTQVRMETRSADEDRAHFTRATIVSDHRLTRGELSSKVGGLAEATSDKYEDEFVGFVVIGELEFDTLSY